MLIHYRARTSTVVLTIMFLLTLVTYLLVRPAPKPARSLVGVVTTPTESHAPTPRPTAPAPTRV
ncbi:MAG TPA: hypothetical protein VEL79_07400, partial [Vicinamibacterales bacterium]|nr:hypothetical protein [Vicinamibacterales bacterium]